MFSGKYILFPTLNPPHVEYLIEPGHQILILMHFTAPHRGYSFKDRRKSNTVLYSIHTELALSKTYSLPSCFQLSQILFSCWKLIPCQNMQ